MEKRKLTSVLLFFVLTTKNQKTGKRKSTSVLSFFVLCAEKKKTKTKIDFRFIVFVSLIRACVANVDIKMFRLSTRGGGGGEGSPRNCRWGV